MYEFFQSDEKTEGKTVLITKGRYSSFYIKCKKVINNLRLIAVLKVQRSRSKQKGRQESDHNQTIYRRI